MMMMTFLTMIIMAIMIRFAQDAVELFVPVFVFVLHLTGILKNMCPR